MVAMTVWPTDAADGSVSSEARWRKMARMWRPTGVIKGISGELAPTLAYPNLTVQAGAVWVDGHYTELAGSQVLTVTANGLAVVRFDPAANTAELLYRDGASTPTQTPGGTWEFSIAQISGSALTDKRGRIWDWPSEAALAIDQDVAKYTYTPVLQNFSVGAGGINTAVAYVSGALWVGEPGHIDASGKIKVAAGGGASATMFVKWTPPWHRATTDLAYPCNIGVARVIRPSVSQWNGWVASQTEDQFIIGMPFAPNGGGFVTESWLGVNTPIAWNVGDEIYWHISTACYRFT